MTGTKRSTIFLCEKHRRVIEEHYFVDELETENRFGVCFGCMSTAWGRSYAIEQRRARYRAVKSGGGERSRAERRAQ